MHPKPLVVANLKKQFGSLIVFRNFSLNVEDGETVVLKGPNGVGKSTLLGCLCGNIIADEGNIYVANLDLMRHPMDARRQLRFVAQEPEIPIGLTGEEVLEFYAGVFQARHQLGEARQQTQLGEALDRLASTYSFGMKKRLAIACQALGNAKLYLFDELLAGLDHASIETTVSWLHTLQNQGCGLLFAAHNQEISALLSLQPRQIDLSALSL